MAIECRPLGRSKGLIVEPLGDELLVYDQERHVAHSLQDVAARVWRACDGTRDASEISEFTGVAVDAVAVALQELFELDLIRGYTPPAQREVSRRTVLRRAATVGAGVGFAVTGEEKCVVRDGLFDELFEEEQFGGVDDGVDALLEGLHGREGLE